MERGSADALVRHHRSAFATVGDVRAGGGAGADLQQLQLLLKELDERHTRHEREINDRLARVEVAITQDQEELMRRLSAVRLPAAAALPRSCCAASTLSHSHRGSLWCPILHSKAQLVRHAGGGGGRIVTRRARAARAGSPQILSDW